MYSTILCFFYDTEQETLAGINVLIVLSDCERLKDFSNFLMNNMKSSILKIPKMNNE